MSGPKQTSDRSKTGYCRPPRAHQWKPGCPSPNPSGRPPKRAKEDLLRQLDPVAASIVRHDNKLISKQTPDGGEDVTRGEAAIEVLYRMGVQGNLKALSEYLRIRSEAFLSKRKLDQQMLEAAVKFQDHYLAQFLRCEKQGKPLPGVLPDPRDIEIRPNGSVQIVGPVTVAQKIQTDQVVEHQTAILKAMEAIKRDDAMPPEFTAKAQKRAKAKLARCNRALPPRLRRHLPQHES